MVCKENMSDTVDVFITVIYWNKYQVVARGVVSGRQ